MPRPPRHLGATLVLPLALTACGAGAANPATSPSPSASGAAPTTVNVRAGVNDPEDPNVAVLAYLPAQVTVAVGTTVRWTGAGPEPHSVTFFPAGEQPPSPDKAAPFFTPTPAKVPYDGTTLANSGLGPQGPGGPLTFEMSFGKKGSYGYVCVIHPLMKGTVVVTDTTEPQSAIDQRGKAEEQQWLAEGREAKKKLVEAGVRKTAGPGGTTWTIEMGATTPHTDVLAFAPVTADIKAGDTVVFVNNSGAPHTATFAGGTEVPQNPEDPKVLAPAPGKSPQTLKATGYVNTGWLPPNAPPGAAPPEAARRFEFKVPAAGTYAYVCVLHVPSGMGGTIKAT